MLFVLRCVVSLWFVLLVLCWCARFVLLCVGVVWLGVGWFGMVCCCVGWCVQCVLVCVGSLCVVVCGVRYVLVVVVSVYVSSFVMLRLVLCVCCGCFVVVRLVLVLFLCVCVLVCGCGVCCYACVFVWSGLVWLVWRISFIVVSSVFHVRSFSCIPISFHFGFFYFMYIIVLSLHVYLPSIPFLSCHSMSLSFHFCSSLSFRVYGISVSFRFLLFICVYVMSLMWISECSCMCCCFIIVCLLNSYLSFILVYVLVVRAFACRACDSLLFTCTSVLRV